MAIRYNGRHSEKAFQEVKNRLQIVRNFFICDIKKVMRAGILPLTCLLYFMTTMALQAQFIKDFNQHKQELSDPTVKEQVYLKNLKEMQLKGQVRAMEQISYFVDNTTVDTVMILNLGTGTDMDTMRFKTRRAIKKSTSGVPGWPNAQLGFDEAGNKTSLEIFIGEEKFLVKKFTMTYDKSGNMLSKSYYLLPDIVEATFRYAYDGQNNLRTESKFDGDGQLIWNHQSKYRFDEQARVIEVKSYYQEKGKTVFSEKNTNEYNDEDHRQIQKFYDKNGKKYRQIILKFNDSSQIKEKHWREDKTHGTTLFYYDDTGSVIKEDFNWNYKRKKARQFKNYFYNSYGILMETRTQSDFEFYKYISGDNTLINIFLLGLTYHDIYVQLPPSEDNIIHNPGIIRRHVFSYDEHGNWTKMQMMDRLIYGEEYDEEEWILRYIIERKIVYYAKAYTMQ